MLIRPEDVDDHTIPVLARHVSLVDIDDRGLVLDETAGRGYALNPTGALVWRLLDSVSPLGEIVDDVSAAFGAPRAEVADGVHGLVRAFGEFGLFENVARNIASLPIDVEYVDVDDCGEVLQPATVGPPFDERYLPVPPNA